MPGLVPSQMTAASGMLSVSRQLTGPAPAPAREAVGPELAPRLPLEARANPKYDNFMDDSCQLGAKATVAAGCMLGRGTTLGDKCSVKRSVLGRLCKVGAGVRCALCTAPVASLFAQAQAGRHAALLDP